MNLINTTQRATQRDATFKQYYAMSSNKFYLIIISLSLVIVAHGSQEVVSLSSSFDKYETDDDGSMAIHLRLSDQWRSVLGCGLMVFLLPYELISWFLIAYTMEPSVMENFCLF